MAAVDLDALASELAERLARGLHIALRRLLELFDLRLTPELAGKLRRALPTRSTRCYTSWSILSPRKPSRG